MSTWEEVSSAERFRAGDRYRWTATLRLPYTYAPKVESVVRAAFAVASVVRIAKLERVVTNAPMMSSRGAVSDRWLLEVYFRTSAAGGPA